MYKRILTFLKKFILLLLSLVILLSAVACNQDTDTDDGKETYKEGLCGPDDIPKDVKMSYYGENLAELKKVFYDEYKKKCDFKCLVPNIEEAEGVSDLYMHDIPLLVTTPIWNESFPVKEHYVNLSYGFELKNVNAEKTYVFGLCDITVYYFDAENVDISDLKVETNEKFIYIKYENHEILECKFGNYIRLNDGTEEDDENFEGREVLIDLLLKNLEYWG